MRRRLTLLAVALQVLVLAWIAGQREWVLWTGQTVYLRTAPIDPRDIFRGDYVQLGYPMSAVGTHHVRGRLAVGGAQREQVLYAVLEPRPGGLAELAYLSDERPAGGLYLRGRAVSQWQPGGMLQVRYGLEQYFVEQGRGREMEERRGTREGVQVPLEIAAALGGGGTAVIRGHRWSALGIGLRVVEPSPPREEPPARAARLELTLQNASAAPLALVLLPADCSLALEPVAWARQDLRPERPECAGLTPREEHVQTLAAGEARVLPIDLDEPRWQITLDGRRVTLAALAPIQRYRVVYRPPAATAGLAAASLIWHGELPSRAFHGRGMVD